jgi:two-component system, NarL family, invasion response regulator UvrY
MSKVIREFFPYWHTITEIRHNPDDVKMQPDIYIGMIPNDMNEILGIMLVDDHALVRDGCRQVLEGAGFRIVAEAANGKEACEQYMRVRPQAVLMDLSMNNTSGFEAIERICSNSPDARILVLTMHDDPLIVSRAMKAGALGYLTKTDNARTLIEAVTRIVQGKPFMSRELAEPFAANIRAANDNPLTALTAREFQIFCMIGEGKTNSEIADVAGMSKKSITNYFIRIKQKLGQDNRADLVKLAIRYGVNKQNVVSS